MSAADADPRLDMREQLVRIDRAIAETRKFVAEQDKLAAEAKKYDRDRNIARRQLAILFVGSVGVFVAGVVALWHTFRP